MQNVQYFDNIFQLNRTTTKEKYDNMEKQLNEFVKFVRNQDLSPIEEIMLVYDKAKMFQSAGNDTSLETRELPDVMATNKAVCAGYTNFFNECMTRLGYKNCALESYVNGTSHMNSIVEVSDEKYGINGIYHFDPTFDSMSIGAEDRTLSYSFFCRSMNEINHLKNERVPRGISIAIMQGMDGKYNEVSNDIPTRTMNVINGFFPSEENKNYLMQNYEKLKDKTNWQSLNEEHLFQLNQIGFKVRRADNISMDTLAQIISNVRRIENPKLIEEELNTQMDTIKEFNNKQFEKYYDDSKLIFRIMPKNYVGAENYEQLLNKINSLYATNGLNNSLQTTVSFTNGQLQQANLIIQSLSNGEEKNICDFTFDSNYDFMTRFLTPLVHEYASKYPYESSQIGKPEYFNLNIRNYISNSINNNSFSIMNGHIDYLQQIDTYIKANSTQIKESGVKMQENKDILNVMNNPLNNYDGDKKNETDILQFMDRPGDEKIDMNQGLDISSLMGETQNSEKPIQTESVQSMMDYGLNESNEMRSEESDIVQFMNSVDSETPESNKENEINEVMDETINNDRINDYNKYRAEVLPYLLNADSKKYIHSDFTFDDTDGKICRHTLEEMTTDTKKVLLQRNFEYDELFRTSMLEPSLVDYAKTNPIDNSNVKLDNNGMAKYTTFSQTDNVLTVNNVSKDYVEYIDQEIKKVNPVLFQKHMEQYQEQMQQSVGGYQKVYKKDSGFLNILLLSSIVGFVAGFMLFIIYFILKTKGVN